MRYLRSKANLSALVILCGVLGNSARAQEYQQEPILYSKSAPEDRVSELIQRLDAEETRLDYEPGFGFLRSILRELQVPESSQTLVFSKTSLQRQRISPRTPRALYFNEDVYVGFCQQGDVIEVSAVDPRLGTVFYTVQQEETDRPRIVRQADNCLLCHASSHTKEGPGHLVRSVLVDSSGMPILTAGTYRVDQTIPLQNRWGGWYVTGTHGAQKHLGNLVMRAADAPTLVDNAAGMNLTELGDRFDASAYLTPHSDIVALMVLEHQTDVHNSIVRANFLTRQAMHQQQALNRELGKPLDHEWESTKSRIKSSCEPLVEGLLFSGEAKLTGQIRGTSGFAQQFARQGPRDGQGRSLREFDLETRLFKVPCSYLIYSPSFKALAREAKEQVLERMAGILAGKDTSKKFAHLTPDDRQSIIGILRATMPELPIGWPAGDATR